MLFARIATCLGLGLIILSTAELRAEETPSDKSHNDERADVKKTQEELEKAATEEAIGVAVAQARAFAPAVSAAQSRYSRVLTDLQAHQILLNRETNRPRRSYGFGPGAQASLLYTSRLLVLQGFLRAEHSPATSNVVHSLHSEAHGLWARFVCAWTIDVTAQLSDHPNHFLKSGSLAGWIFVLDNPVHRSPFIRLEDRFAI